MFAGMDLRLTVLMYPQRGSFKIRFQKFENLNFKFSVEILEDWREKKTSQHVRRFFFRYRDTCGVGQSCTLSGHVSDFVCP
jgi:hypothetical protein